jgi:uncharacterized GH25 family protein
MNSISSAFRKSLAVTACCMMLAGLAFGQSAPAKPADASTAPATSPASIPEETKTTIAGKVTDAAGLAVEGAEVQVHFLTNFIYTTTYAGNGFSKADGSFEISLAIPSDSQFGMVTAKKAGLAVGWDNYHVGAMFDERRQSLAITLGKPAVLEGTVVDETGTAIANADVMALLMSASRDKQLILSSSSQLRVATDNKGQFRIEDVPANCQAEFIVSGTGKARIVTRVSDNGGAMPGQFHPGQADIKITLPPECRIEGTIVDQAGSKPIPSVTLMAMGVQHTSFLPFASKSDEQGRFVFDHLPAGQYSIILRPTRDKMSDWVFDPDTAEAVEAVATSPSASQPAPLKIKAGKGGIVEILVVDSADGKPIPQANISLRRSGESKLRNDFSSAQTNQAGIARLRLLPREWTITNANAKGYEQLNVSGGATDASAPSPIAIVDGQTTTSKIELKSLPKYRGVVKDSAGQAVEGAEVTVFGNFSGNTCTTDKAGQFTAEVNQAYYGMPGNNKQTPCIIVRHQQRNQAAVVEVTDEAKPIEVTLAPAGTLYGLVTAPDGKPIAGATISLSILIGNMGSNVDRSPIKTDAQGKFEITAIPPDQKYYLTVTADGYGQFQIQPGKIEISASRVEAPPIVLEIADQSIAGLVVDADDKPLAGAQVNTSGTNQPNRNVTTDKNGKFEITKVVAGQIELNAWASNPANSQQQYGNARANSGDKDIKIVMGTRSSGGPAASAETKRPLLNKPLPKLESLGLKADSELAGDKAMLICFFDMESRPSRRVVQAISAKAAELAAKGVVVVLVHAGSGDESALQAWADQNKITCPIGMVAPGAVKSGAGLANWGVEGLPWLIYAGPKHVVLAEGFAIEQLDKVLADGNSAGSATKPAAGQ